MRNCISTTFFQRVALKVEEQTGLPFFCYDEDTGKVGWCACGGGMKYEFLYIYLYIQIYTYIHLYVYINIHTYIYAFLKVEEESVVPFFCYSEKVGWCLCGEGREISLLIYTYICIFIYTDTYICIYLHTYMLP